MPKRTQAPGDELAGAAAQPMTGGSAPGIAPMTVAERRAALERRVDDACRSAASASATTAREQVGADDQQRKPGERERRCRTASASTGCSRRSGTGRSRVRRISASGSRSMTWLNADAPPATSAVPTTVQTSRNVERVAARHHVAGKRRYDDQQVQPRLGQRDEVGRARGAAADMATRVDSHGRVLPAIVLRAPAAGRAARRTSAAVPASRKADAEATQRQHERRAQHERAVDDVRGVDDRLQADQTTKAPRVTCTQTKQQQQRAPAAPVRGAGGDGRPDVRRPSPGSPAVTTSAPTRCAKWIAIFAFQTAASRWPNASGKSGIASPGARVPHRRAEDNLAVDQRPSSTTAMRRSIGSSTGGRRRSSSPAT